MSQALIDELLATIPTETKDEWEVLRDEQTCTFYASRDGASLTIPRVEAFKKQGSLLVARTRKSGIFAVVQDAVFSVSVDDSEHKERRAGFGV